MILNKISARSLIPILLLALTACGQNPENLKLPDDPTNEAQVANPTTGETETPVAAVDPADEALASVDKASAQSILSQYSYVDPSGLIADRLLSAALLYYDNNKSTLKNKSYLSVIDFSKKSTEKRFFIINMSTGAVWAIHVAHGKGSDANHDGFLDSFSNQSGSNATSQGFYKTAETYSGAHGLSLRLDGLSSTNSNVRSRAIVIHGADYVQEASVIQGRSWGCPAVAMENRDRVISLIKGGSLIYANR